MTGLVRVRRIGAKRRRIGEWLTGHAGWCLAVSLTAHVLAVVSHPTEPLDLRVYHGAAPHVLSGGLYDFAVHTGPPIPLLPFTYPPFAALVFLPLSRLPWTATVVLWQVLSVAALLVIVACAFRLLPARPDGRGRARVLLWTAVGLWLEPVRHTLDQGQVNLLLGAVVLAGLAAPWGAGRRGAAPGSEEAGGGAFGAGAFGAEESTRGALWRGAAVGLAAAVKLTPAVGGLYLLATRQWRAALWAVVAGGTATAVAWGVAPEESARYWTVLVTRTQRVGPLWSVRNQSLRGAVARLVGQDGGAVAPVWWTALVLVTGAAAWALWAAVRRGDRLGALVAVELYGLLVCPVSWSHHWIWCLPAMIWLAHGPLRRRPFARLALAVWALAAGARVVPLLIRAEDHLAHPSPYPALLAWPGCVYAVCALLTFLALAVGPPESQARAGTSGAGRPGERTGRSAEEVWGASSSRPMR
ncbi:glycosyltransferase 87 family protein [Streptomyces sp. NPDC086766]|uniref:glycosyltransferase 87 family protein n=1 Tax=Streptomyces sp. NPDC086766 TaxID=3365754 RepID=UPI00381510A1